MNLTIREYSFFVISLIAAVWFFVTYPSQDPRTAVDLSVDAATVEQKAISRLETLGYPTPQFQIQTSFHANRELLDSLQAELGREGMISRFQGNGISNIEPYYWVVSFRKTAADEPNTIINSRSEDDEAGPFKDDARVLEMRFDAEGNFLELINDDNILPVKMVSRPAIAAIFPAKKDSVIALLSQFNDSALAGQFFVNIQQDWNQMRDTRGQWLQRIESILRQKRHYMLSGQDVFKMAAFYLEQTGWDLSSLATDSVMLGSISDINTASARFKLKNPKLDQKLSLNVELTPAGGLLGITSTYNANGGDGNDFPGLWPIFRNAIVFMFCLAGVIIFFFRIRARAIDTKPALAVSVVAGIGTLLLILMSGWADPSIWSSEGEIIIYLVSAGMAGAASCLLFFVFFGIGDSIIRQHWSKKLGEYDYLRQGMLFNKPVGIVVVRSVMLAFILAGLWTLLLDLFPNLYFNIRHVFLQEEAVWPPLYLFLSSGWFSLSLVLGIFMVLGGQAYAQFKNKAAASTIMVLACAIVGPVCGNYGPVVDEIVVSAIFGVILTLIYLKWDFLTLLLSHFLFLGLIETAPGWIIQGSMDTYIFISFLLLMIFLMVSGLLAIARGKEEQGLSRFVPEYVEELAQEERIKQELQIAREVQQSFLPVRTPQFERLELSAICKPAYETGGDYYDFIPLDKNRLAVTIGDVSGKGIQAAFYMTFVKGIIHSLCREVESPAELLKKANSLFYDNAPRGTFISLVYGIIDLEEHTFRFARAGHNPVLKVDAGDGAIRELQPKGIGIGLAKNTSFDDNIEEIELNLCTEDMLILYTDGIVEALDGNHKFYGTGRLNNLLNKNKGMSAEGLLKEITQDVHSYIGNAKQHDDMTMMVMKLKKN